MAQEEVVVIGLGMLTAVGLSAAETAASVRAGTARFAETPWPDRWEEPFVAAAVPEDALPPLAEPLGDQVLTARERRLLRLATEPLREALQPLASRFPPPGLDLALPETGGGSLRGPRAFLEHLAVQTEGAFDVRQSLAVARGRAGGLLAVGRAGQRIREQQAPFVLAGGLDTCWDPRWLSRFDGEQRLQTSHNLDGFLPGEGAGFVLLAGRQVAAQEHLRPLAVLSPVAQGKEEGHLYSEQSYRGDGLAGTLAQLLAGGHAAEPIREVFSSMNGENYWAKEWGVAFVQHREAFHPDHRLHHPADCFGDTGAACGPLLVGLAVVGLGQGYRQGPCLVYASSDHEERAALAIRTP